MLILTRFVGERVAIDQDIWITILGEQNGCVSLGINAPPNIAIYREELLEHPKDDLEKTKKS